MRRSWNVADEVAHSSPRPRSANAKDRTRGLIPEWKKKDLHDEADREGRDHSGGEGATSTV